MLSFLLCRRTKKGEAVINNSTNSKDEVLKCLEKLKKKRCDIDKIDEKIVCLLNKRFDCCSEIASLKQDLNLNITDLKRQEDVLMHISMLSKDEFVDLNKLVFSTIMHLSTNLQQRFKK